MTREDVLRIKKSDIEKIQRSGKGLAISDQNIYKVLKSKNIKFGEMYSKNGRSSFIGTLSTKDFRRENHSDCIFFFYYKDEERIYLPSDREIWNEVESNILIEKREVIINNILNVV